MSLSWFGSSESSSSASSSSNSPTSSSNTTAAETAAATPVKPDSLVTIPLGRRRRRRPAGGHVYEVLRMEGVESEGGTACVKAAKNSSDSFQAVKSNSMDSADSYHQLRTKRIRLKLGDETLSSIDLNQTSWKRCMVIWTQCFGGSDFTMSPNNSLLSREHQWPSTASLTVKGKSLKNDWFTSIFEIWFSVTGPILTLPPPKRHSRNYCSAEHNQSFIGSIREQFM